MLVKRIMLMAAVLTGSTAVGYGGTAALTQKPPAAAVYPRSVAPPAPARPPQNTTRPSAADPTKVVVLEFEP